MNEDIIRAVAARVPGVVQYLTGRAWWIATTSESDIKTVDYYRYNLERLLRNLYANRIGGEFIDIMADERLSPYVCIAYLARFMIYLRIRLLHPDIL